ncbi:DUF5054 domain-containing protein [Sphingobacterium lumbrici]|uniref:DUF5054 domain-containing protein n=1 Tax=Sphingobacterium lumbrici TaxID=2559600 RepID=UPI001C0FE84C|nr:DUF5054 domain-containing protein [Sphingobacterium lumbrici]
MGFLFIFGFDSFGQLANSSVKNVHIIFKTHLDIGFTELSSVVEKRYIDEFIPKAIAVAEELRSSGAKERYVWTTGSWLIQSYLDQATAENKEKLKAAIQRGDIVWNAIPYTVESESMNKTLFKTILQLSKRLDKQFGKKTIAGKMTDVPGHTRSIVPLLQQADIEFLHIGVNPASKVPEVPALCRWLAPDGSEVILMYQKDYGSDIVLPDGSTAMVLAFTGDNHGPHTVQRVKDIYASVQMRYPNATLVASSLSDVAQILRPMKALLPVVTQEIGDTWIHGYGSSPLMMARFRAVSRLYEAWVKDGRIDPKNDSAIRFAITLGLVAEHTWGLDVKTHLKNWDKYDFDNFQQALALPEFKKIEASWAEKEAHIAQSLQYLPADLREEAEVALRDIESVVKPVWSGEDTSRKFTKEGVLPLDKSGFQIKIGELTYQTFSLTDFDRFRDTYITQKVDWAIRDFGKPGLTTNMARSHSISARLQKSAYSKGRNEIINRLELCSDSVDPKVLPKEIYSTYHINERDGKIQMSYTLVDKPSNRLPEAYWLSFYPEQVLDILVEKVGQPISVLDVVEGGNRQMHGLDHYVDILTTAGKIRIRSADAPLVAVGARDLLNYSTKQPNIKGGVHFCLFNNVWGTNFRMWFGGTVTYRFDIELLKIED